MDCPFSKAHLKQRIFRLLAKICPSSVEEEVNIFFTKVQNSKLH